MDTQIEHRVNYMGILVKGDNTNLEYVKQAQKLQKSCNNYQTGCQITQISKEQYQSPCFTRNHLCSRECIRSSVVVDVVVFIDVIVIYEQWINDWNRYCILPLLPLNRYMYETKWRLKTRHSSDPCVTVSSWNVNSFWINLKKKN